MACTQNKSFRAHPSQTHTHTHAQTQTHTTHTHANTHTHTRTHTYRNTHAHSRSTHPYAAQTPQGRMVLARNPQQLLAQTHPTPCKDWVPQVVSKGQKSTPTPYQHTRFSLFYSLPYSRRYKFRLCYSETAEPAVKGKQQQRGQPQCSLKKHPQQSSDTWPA